MEELIDLNNQNKQKNIRFVIMVTVITIAVMITGIILILAFSPVSVSGYSMYPTIDDGDIIVINRLDKNPQIGDIVVYEKPNDNINVIKRVVGVQGDKFRITKQSDNKFLGALLKLSSTGEYEKVCDLRADQIISLTNYYGGTEFVIDEGKFFAVGDNAIDSVDCRDYGAAYKKHILGTVRKDYPVNEDMVHLVY